MKQYNKKRIITCSSLGVGSSYNDCSYLVRFFIYMIISKPIADKNIQEELLFNSGLDFIIVRPADLTDKASYCTFETENVSGGRIPRFDVTTFMLRQIYSDEYLGKAVSLTS